MDGNWKHRNLLYFLGTIHSYHSSHFKSVKILPFFRLSWIDNQNGVILWWAFTLLRSLSYLFSPVHVMAWTQKVQQLSI